VRQCLIYDTPNNPARLIGVEYMITPRLYEQLEKEERLLWHSHDYEARLHANVILYNLTAYRCEVAC
jgi:hypothetical protein